MAKAARANTRLQSQRVFVRQRFNAVTGAAQSNERLLDAPEMAIKDARQREELLRPLPADRVAVHETKAAIHAGKQLVPEARANHVRRHGVNVTTVGIERVPPVGWVLDPLQVNCGLGKEQEVAIEQR